MFSHYICLTAVVVACVAAEYIHLDVARQIKPEPRLLRRQSFQASLLQNNQVEYLVNITVGTPPQNLAVTLDTGSSDLWVPAISSQPCKQDQCDGGMFDPTKSSSYNLLEQGGFNITYAGPEDSDAGDWVEETVSIGGSKKITNTIMGIALEGYDDHGVMGVGFDTGEAQPNPSGNGVYPSVMDHLKSEGLINRAAYSLYLNNLNATTGNVCFGCIDSTKYSGNLVALPLQAGEPGSGPEGSDPSSPNAFWVTLSRVSFVDAVGAETQLSPDDYAQSVLLDSGTSQTFFTNDVLTGLSNGLGGVFYSQGIVVPCSFSNTNASIKFAFGGSNGPTILVPLSQMVSDQTLTAREYPGHSAGGCYLGASGPIQGAVILGDTFLRSAYVVYDLDNYQVAIAQAVGGKIDTSSIVVMSSGTAIPGASSTASASATMLSGDAANAQATDIPTANGRTVTAGTPTFNLGSMATASNATPSSGILISAGRACQITSAPQAAVLGAVGLAGLVML